jgi:thioredoxin 1
MALKPIEVSDSDFEDQVIKSDLAVLVDFWAPWCAPCHMVSPIVEELAESMQDQLKVCKVNVDESPIVAQSYGIRAIPTLMLFVKGEESKRIVGVRPKHEIESEIKAAIK